MGNECGKQLVGADWSCAMVSGCLTSIRNETAPRPRGTCRNRVDASVNATTPDAAVPTINASFPVKGFEPDGERNQERKRHYNRLSNPTRVDIVLHYLHALRDNEMPDAILRDARHRAENYRDRGNHFGL